MNINDKLLRLSETAIEAESFLRDQEQAVRQIRKCVYFMRGEIDDLRIRLSEKQTGDGGARKTIRNALNEAEYAISLAGEPEMTMGQQPVFGINGQIISNQSCRSQEGSTSRE